MTVDQDASNLDVLWRVGGFARVESIDIVRPFQFHGEIFVAWVIVLDAFDDG